MTTKYLYVNQGVTTEAVTLETSTGATDANKIPSTKADGTLDPSVLGASSSGGANKIPILDANGRLTPNMLPAGTGADTASVQASEALSAGDLVNVWDSGGAFRARKADASAVGKEAHGYVLAAVASGALATVYFEGTNTAATSLTPGRLYLSAAAPGKATATPPTGTGKVVQSVGVGVSATSLNFNLGEPIVLA